MSAFGSGIHVTVLGDVWSSWRYRALANMLGVAMPADVVGRCASLWHWCKSEQTEVAPRHVVDGYLGAGGADALLACDLADEVDGGLFIRGMPKQLAQLGAWREQRVQAGRARAARAARIGGKFSKSGDKGTSEIPAAAGEVNRNDRHGPTSGAPAEHQRSTSEPPAAAGQSLATNPVRPLQDSASSAADRVSDATQSPASHQRATSEPPASTSVPSLSLSDPEEEKNSLSGGARARPHAIPGLGSTHAVARTARQTLANEIWREHQEARDSVAHQLDITARPLPVQDAGRGLLADRILEHCVEGLDVAAERCRHVLAVCTRDCLDERTLDFLDGQLWRKDRFDKSNATTLDAPRRRRSNGHNGHRRDGPPSPMQAVLDDIAADKRRAHERGGGK